MMGLQFVYPLIATALYVIVFQKAGLRGPILAACGAPVLGTAIALALVRVVVAGGDPRAMLVIIPVVTIALTLLPLFILAFKSWPPVGAAPYSRSEK